MGNQQCFSGISRTGRGGNQPVKLTTGYWKFRGLGAPMRMMCVYADVVWNDEQFEVKRKSGGGWISPESEARKKELQKVNPLAQLPYVVNHVTGEVVSQTLAVYLYLGRLLDLAGATETERLANEQMLFYLFSMWMENGDFVYPFKQNANEAAFTAGLEVYFNKVIPNHYDKMESWLKHNDTPFFAGRSPCTADFHAWEIMDQHEAMAKTHGFASPLIGYDTLAVFYEHFRKQPRLSRYFDSDFHSLPINNKMAFFK